MSFLKKLFNKEEKKSINSYQDFWKWFLENEKQFHNIVSKGGSENITTNFFDKITPRLNELKDGISVLTGMLDDNTVDLILTADGKIKNFFFIEELVASSPNLDRWEFRAHKPACEINNIGIQMYGYEFNTSNLFFYSNEIENYPDEIDITIVHSDLTEENENDVIEGSFIFIENYLGELNSLTLIDNISFKSKDKAEKELIPIEKLKSFITWREKEFVEKYEGIRKNTENDSYSSLKATLENGNQLIATINTSLLEWDSKASHPWVLSFEIAFGGDQNGGFPDKETNTLMYTIEDEILEELIDSDGYLNIGRQTANGIREIYFACKDFRKPCKVADFVKIKYASKIQINFEIYKDKYWCSFERFQA